MLFDLFSITLRNTALKVESRIAYRSQWNQLHFILKIVMAMSIIEITHFGCTPGMYWSSWILLNVSIHSKMCHVHEMSLYCAKFPTQNSAIESKKNNVKRKYYFWSSPYVGVWIANRTKWAGRNMFVRTRSSLRRYLTLHLLRSLCLYNAELYKCLNAYSLKMFIG